MMSDSVPQSTALTGPDTSDGAAPGVTVIVATYNRSNIVGYAIRSVLAQTQTDWELLVHVRCAAPAVARRLSRAITPSCPIPFFAPPA